MSLNDQFSVIPNIIFKDPRLDYRSKGILCTLLVQPEDWNFSISNIEQLVAPVDDGTILNDLKGEGKTAIRSCIQKLEKLGYLKRIPKHNDKGLFDGYEYKLIIPSQFKD